MNRVNSRTGMTLLEVAVALTLFTVLMVVVTMNVHREAASLGAMARKTYIHGRLDIVLDQVKDELEYAAGFAPEAWITATLGAGGTSVTVDTTRGFPNSGYLLLEPGTANEERIEYTSLVAAPPSFEGLVRGYGGTLDTTHGAGVQIRWGGTAAPIEDQVNPPADQFEGLSRESIGDVFYRGDGTGFSYQLPVDILGNGTYFDGNGEIQWGAVVNGNPIADGFSAIYYEAAVVVTEVGRGGDLNDDGDTDDTFDLGRIRVRTWDPDNPGTAYSDVALGPPIILQESGNWGGDLDADGFEDPLLLWDEESSRVRVRFFALAEAAEGHPDVRRVESTLFLPNGTGN